MIDCDKGAPLQPTDKGADKGAGEETEEPQELIELPAFPRSQGLPPPMGPTLTQRSSTVSPHIVHAMVSDPLPDMTPVIPDFDANYSNITSPSSTATLAVAMWNMLDTVITSASRLVRFSWPALFLMAFLVSLSAQLCMADPISPQNNISMTSQPISCCHEVMS